MDRSKSCLEQQVSTLFLRQWCEHMYARHHRNWEIVEIQKALDQASKHKGHYPCSTIGETYGCGHIILSLLSFNSSSVNVSHNCINVTKLLGDSNKRMWKHSIITKGCSVMVVTWNYTWNKTAWKSHTHKCSRKWTSAV